MIKKFISNIRGNIVVSAAVLSVPLMAGIGAAADYALLNRAKTNLQSAADTAALASAKELGLTNANKTIIKEAAKSYVYTNLANNLKLEEGTNRLAVEAFIPEDKSGVKVDLAYYWKPMLLHYFGGNVLPIRVSATANLAGEGKVCMIGLEKVEEHTIHLTKRARLEAKACGIYANSVNKDAIRVEDDAAIIAGVTCAAGGVKGSKKASFQPDPLTDCPAISDPLADRVPPPVGACDHKGFEVESGSHVLNPGTYCKGLKIKGTAKVKLRPGIYVINGDKLEVTDDASIEGEHVGFYLAGNKAKLVFKKRTTIHLTAPKTGLMAGLLMFEDRNASKIEKHEITSDNARMLLGTIYLPNGTLKIDSEGPIADKAAYTAIIARAIKLHEGPTLYLNSDYDATDVPVPEGLVRDGVFLAN